MLNRRAYDGDAALPVPPREQITKTRPLRNLNAFPVQLDSITRTSGGFDPTHHLSLIFGEMSEHLFGRTHLDDLASPHESHAITDISHKINVVRPR